MRKACAKASVDPALFCIARPDLAFSPGRSQWRDATAGAEKDNEWRISGKDRAGNSWVVPVGRLINLAGNAQFYRADLDRNGIQDLVIWLGNPGLGLAPSAQYIIFTFLNNGRPCVFEPWGFIPPPILASMICLIYRAMGARNCWICSLTQATG